MSAGYVHCPCCGYDTVASDDNVPELCSDCEEHGCEPDGSCPECSSEDNEDPDDHNFGESAW